MKATTKTTPKAKASTLSADEKAAMQDAIRERKAAAKGGNGEADVLAKIAEMDGMDKAIGERLHAIVKSHAPQMQCKTWYGMPAYTLNGETICFYQHAGKFKARYGTLGFSDKAKLDHGKMWPNAYALTEITDAEEKQIIALLKQAIG